MHTPTTTNTGEKRASAAAAQAGFWPVLLCWVAVALDGFDLVVLGVLVVLGAVIAVLSKSGDLGFTDSTLTLASTVLRFLAGLGLGACLPTGLAFMSEHARPGRGGTAVTRMMTGDHVGAVLTALLALVLVEPLG